MIKHLHSFSPRNFSLQTAACLFVFFAFTAVAEAQQVIYSTNFGTTATTLGTLQTNWTAGGVNNLQLSIATASTGYSTPIAASAGSNLCDCGTTTGVSTATLAGAVNTTGFNNIRVLMSYRGTASYTGPVSFDWSTDGVTWNALTFTPTYDATWRLAQANWYTLPAGAENQSNLRFRFTFTRNSAGAENFKIDDFTVMGTSTAGPTLATHYFRSRQSGNYEYASTWQSSADNVTWVNASLAPTSAAAAITIQSPHSVTINDASSGKTMTINSGATLSQTNGVTFTLLDAAGTDLTIFGTFVLNGSIPTYGSSTFSVESGGVVRAARNTSPGLSDDFVHSNTNITFRTGSVFEWNTSEIFQSSGNTYFNSATEQPIFRITANVTFGAGASTTVNGFFEVASGVTVTITNAGARIFRDGFGGAGTINMSNGSIQVTGTNSATTRITGTGTTNLSGTTTGVFINNLAQVTLNSNYTVNGAGFNFTVSSGGWLNCGTNVLSGTGNFVLASGGRLGIGSTVGITDAGLGNIQTTGRSYSSGANYLYNNGTANQVTGGFSTTPTANRVNSLIIANTGFTVTLSAGNNNLTATVLELNNGIFAAGTGQNINIANGGRVNGNGGTQPNNATAGTVTFVAGAGVSQTNGNASGRPALYSVILNCGVDFNGNPNTNSATIVNGLQLNGGSFVTEAPFYETGSSLIYNNGGTFARNVEWGSASNQGYPHHVVVQNSTVLDLFTNSVSPAELSAGGDLVIGNATGRGEVYMNNNMNKPLLIRGNLIIGSTGVAAANNSRLRLSDVIGGDLILHGNFERHSNGLFDDVNRAVFLRGSTNSAISTPGVTPGAGSNPATQFFSFLFIDKSAITNTVTLNCPVAVSNTLHLTSGQVATSLTNLLILPAGTFYAGGTDNSFVTGPMRKIGNTSFRFPVGKPETTGPASRGTPLVGGFRPIEMSAPGNSGDAYTAEFFLANANLLGPVAAPAAPLVVRVSACEYWALDRFSGSSNTPLNVTVMWEARSKCNYGSYVSNPATTVLVRNTGTPLVSSSGNWNEYGGTGTGSTTTGTVTWNNFNFFNSNRTPLALGSININDNLLPFELADFQAAGKGKQVQLDWRVTNNQQMKEYTIERSRDGRRFELLKTVGARVQEQQASYTQLDPAPFAGWNFYRLRALTQQGEVYYSETRRVKMGQVAEISISPNPAHNILNIRIPGAANVTELTLSNSAGQVLFQLKPTVDVLTVDLSAWPAGVYYLRIITTNGINVKQFVKE